MFTAWLVNGGGVRGVPAGAALAAGCTLELELVGAVAYVPIEVSICGKIFPLSSAKA